MTKEEIEKLFTYHAPTSDSVNRLVLFREAAKEFCYVLDQNVPDSADKSAAIRKLRECVMTANVAIVLNQ